MELREAIRRSVRDAKRLSKQYRSCIIDAMSPSLFKFRFLWHPTAIVFSVSAAFSTLAKAQSPWGSPDAEAEKTRIVDKAFIKCGGSNSRFLGLINRSNVECTGLLGGSLRRIKSCQTLFEFEDASFDKVPDPTFSLADKRNGFKWIGYVTLTYSLSRERHVLDGAWEKWGPWVDGPAKSNPYLVERFWNNAGKVSGEAGPALVNFGIPIIAKVAGATIPRLEQLEKVPSCADILNPGAHQGTVLDRRPPLESISLQDRQFNGTADEFAAAFPGFLRRAADVIGVDSRSYQKETDFIVSQIKLCAAVTPEMARKATFGRGLIALTRLGDEYKVCDGFGTEDRVRKYQPNVERAIVVFVSGLIGAGERLQKGDGRPFTVQVTFNQLERDKSDWDWDQNAIRAGMFGNYGIVSAKIR